MDWDIHKHILLMWARFIWRAGLVLGFLVGLVILQASYPRVFAGLILTCLVVCLYGASYMAEKDSRK